MEIQPIVSENWHDWNSDNGFSIDLLSYHIRLGFFAAPTDNVGRNCSRNLKAINHSIDTGAAGLPMLLKIIIHIFVFSSDGYVVAFYYRQGTIGSRFG